tara:strand:+ start:276 stop:668 length:393 start_codon:yes stop_codon:yes gene_type:complete
MEFEKKYGSIDPKPLAKWITLDDAEFLIAPSQTIAFRNEALKLFNVGDIDSESLGKRKASDLVGLESEIKSRTVLLDWKNVKEEDKEIPYSQEKAYELLTTFDEFRTWVDEQSDLLAEQREKATKQIKKK